MKTKSNYRHIYPLHAALTCGYVDLAIRLLKNNVSANSKDEFGKTPLHHAILGIKDPNRRYDICKLLLDLGANVNESDILQDSPLHYALDHEKVKDDDCRLFNLLISRGADIHRRNVNKYTPLFKAVIANNLVATKQLLKMGALPNKPNYKCMTMQSIAVSNGNEKILKLLLSYNANLDDVRSIFLASISGQVKLLRAMVDNGADFAKVNVGRLLLDVILDSEAHETVECLLENGVDLRIGDSCILGIVYTMYMSNYDSLRKMLYVIIKHIVIRMEADLKSIPECTLRTIKNSDFLIKEFDNFTREIRRMKEIRVYEKSRLTYFDLLSKRGKALTKCCDKNIVLTLSKSKYEKMFPSFAARLERNIRRGLLQKNIFDNFQQTLYDILKPRRISYDLVCYISEFVNVSDLRAFTRPSDDNE